MCASNTGSHRIYSKHAICADHENSRGSGELKIFSSEQARNLIEQEFLTKGVLIRERCPNLGIRQRPLGNSVLETLGFGATFVSYRNCPNNAPLVFWVGDPWYPLFPRFTNTDSAIQRLFEAL
ncbi:phosphoribosyltransferase-like protein [Pseudomonas aeruginosa]|uniref:phosphoribosyltransferase-like protein n=1 Tax=Pseudomonas aeruginosa TaxID=287 RepID=UPI003F6E38AC